MLTSFFEKSNPINYVIIGVFICFGYILGGFRDFPEMLTLSALGMHFLFMALMVFGMFLLDFLIRKNHLTKNNTFGIFCFGCFIVMLPVVFTERQFIIAMLFLLLGFRRILSLTSERNVEKKILDASLWVGIATFFYFWSILFFAVLFFQILQQKHATYKHLIIPFVGVLVVASIASAYWLVAHDMFPQWRSFTDNTEVDYSTYHKTSVLLPASILGALLVWATGNKLMKLSRSGKKSKPNQIILIIALATMAVISLAAPTKSGGELLFVLPPLAIVVANYLERVKEYWFREGLLWMLLVTAVVMVFL